jgi:hypothetical protein
MAFRLIPKDIKFFDLFTADGDNLAEVAAKLSDMVDKFDRLDERVAEIQALEKKGDEIDEALVRRLEDAFVTPFDREDIHELSVRLDDVVDVIQAIAETLVIYDVKTPTEECKRLARILAESSDELAAALRKLESMKNINGHLEKVHHLEHEADGLSRAAVARLFRESVDPLEVIKWRDLYRELENAIDGTEDAAEAIERMLHKSS